MAGYSVNFVIVVVVPMQEEFESGKLLSFSTVAAKLLALVSAPLFEALSGQPMVSVHMYDRAKEAQKNSTI